MKQTKTLPAMTRAEWEALPAIVRYFHHWKRAKRPLVIATKNAPDNGATSALPPLVYASPKR
jgi:hypothetical protein